MIFKNWLKYKYKYCLKTDHMKKCNSCIIYSNYFCEEKYKLVLMLSVVMI